MDTAKREEEWVSTDKVALVDFLAKPCQGEMEYIVNGISM
jgi:hypothetical protein